MKQTKRAPIRLTIEYDNGDVSVLSSRVPEYCGWIDSCIVTSFVHGEDSQPRFEWTHKKRWTVERVFMVLGNLLSFRTLGL